MESLTELTSRGASVASLFIEGSWRQAHEQDEFIIFNPATAQAICKFSDANRVDIEAAVDAAHHAKASWAAATGTTRSRVLSDAAILIRERVAEIASVLSQETGKPLAEATGEVLNSARFLDWYSHEALRLPGEFWNHVTTDRSAYVLKEPVGVVAAITPWNFPVLMLACKVGPALAAGCTVVLKPAEATPLSTRLIVDVFREVGLPSGVLNLITTSRASDFGSVVTQSPKVNCITFTGSQRVGEVLLAQSAGQMKRVLLELGGNSPAIVLEDADIEVAIAELIKARFANAGQACVAANRMYVHSSIAATFTEKFAIAADQLVLGDPTESGTQMGPLIDLGSVEILDQQVATALAQGAELVTGGQRANSNAVSAFYEPSVLRAPRGVYPSVFAEEIFGPVISITEFDTDAEAISMANDSKYGLAAYVFGESSHAFDVARKIESGSVGVNCALISEPALPFGGIKTSGIGRERGRPGIEEYLELKTIQTKERT